MSWRNNLANWGTGISKIRAQVGGQTLYFFDFALDYAADVLSERSLT